MILKSSKEKCLARKDYKSMKENGPIPVLTTPLLAEVMLLTEKLSSTIQ